MNEMGRRRFFQSSLGGLFGLGLLGGSGRARQSGQEPFTKRYWKQMNYSMPRFRMRRLTRGPFNHFFGYYDVSPWSRDESRMAGLQSAFHDRMPREDEPAAIGLVDPLSGAFTDLDETRAWNLSQGSMIHWSSLDPNFEVIYNDRICGGFRAVRLHVLSGAKTVLPRPVSGVGRTGRHALCLTWGRLSRLRKGYGYGGAEDPNPDVAHPENDGVFLQDLANCT